MVNEDADTVKDAIVVQWSQSACKELVARLVRFVSGALSVGVRRSALPGNHVYICSRKYMCLSPRPLPPRFCLLVAASSHGNDTDAESLDVFLDNGATPREGAQLERLGDFHRLGLRVASERERVGQ